MLKYVNTSVVFQEIPDEVTLAINISNCPCRCPGCHSKFLWTDTGQPLTESSLTEIISSYGGDITCIAFMGGDADPKEIDALATYIHRNYPGYHVAWYSGRVRISSEIDRNNFEYIKIGPYLKHLGSLKDKTTNQRLYRRTPDNTLEDITHRFWRS